MNTYFESIDLEKVLEIIVAFNTERDSLKLLDIILTKMRGIALCEAGTLYVVRDGKLHFSIMHNEHLGTFLREEEITLPPISLNQEVIENVSAYCAIRNKTILCHINVNILDSTISRHCSRWIIIKPTSTTGLAVAVNRSFLARISTITNGYGYGRVR